MWLDQRGEQRQTEVIRKKSHSGLETQLVPVLGFVLSNQFSSLFQILSVANKSLSILSHLNEKNSIQKIFLNNRKVQKVFHFLKSQNQTIKS